MAAKSENSVGRKPKQKAELPPAPERFEKYFTDDRIIPKSMGRTAAIYSLTLQEVRTYFQRIRLGASWHIAAMSLGINYETIRRWMRLGREQRRGIYRDFFWSVRECEAEVLRQCESSLALDNPLHFLKVRAPAFQDFPETNWRQKDEPLEIRVGKTQESELVQQQQALIEEQEEENKRLQAALLELARLGYANQQFLTGNIVAAEDDEPEFEDAEVITEPPANGNGHA